MICLLKWLIRSPYAPQNRFHVLPYTYPLIRHEIDSAALLVLLPGISVLYIFFFVCCQVLAEVGCG